MKHTVVNFSLYQSVSIAIYALLFFAGFWFCFGWTYMGIKPLNYSYIQKFM